jgi:hypothetical protein
LFKSLVVDNCKEIQVKLAGSDSQDSGEVFSVDGTKKKILVYRQRGETLSFKFLIESSSLSPFSVAACTSGQEYRCVVHLQQLELSSVKILSWFN